MFFPLTYTGNTFLFLLNRRQHIPEALGKPHSKSRQPSQNTLFVMRNLHTCDDDLHGVITYEKPRRNDAKLSMHFFKHVALALDHVLHPHAAPLK